MANDLALATAEAPRRSPPPFRAVNDEQFLPDPPSRLQFNVGRFRQGRKPKPVRDCRGTATANNLRANRQVKFIHDAGSKQGVIEFAAAFAQESLNPMHLV